MTAAEQSLPSRFVVGLDLGTTNSAMAYVDTAERRRTIRTFDVPQVVAPGHIEARETVPSFLYQPVNNEFPADAVRLPWNTKSDSIVGHFARDHGTLVPGRMIASAKSWLCHNGVDRTAALLPWQGAEDLERLSPVTVSARYLAHFRAAWDHKFPDHPLAEQDFVLTIPASFDEVARELTIQAARQAGLQRVVLIEEPQAAFYAWIDKHSDHWGQLVTSGQKILVCDVGGGTTDFTLIRVQKGGNDSLQFHRVAVGDHLILGGDNLDLALAHHLEQRIKPNGRLEPRQWSVLVRSCRQLKETLMGADAPEIWTLTLPGSGSKLIGGSIQIPVTRAEVEALLVDGFFPDVPLDSKPQSSHSGFQEFGLPYASDPAVTKHLAAFLSAHRFFDADDVTVADGSVIDSNDNGHGSQGDGRNQEIRTSLDSSRTSDHRVAVLFNGGVFASPRFRERLIQSLKRWIGSAHPDWSPIVLENERLDLAVARGAAYYGMVRRGEGVRIAAGLARTYYIGVEHSDRAEPQSALCLLPAGIEPGIEVDLTEHQFQLLVAQPIEFPLYVSSTRLSDRAGALVAVDPEQIKELPPIRTVLKTARSKEATTVAVILKAKLTEIGTLDVWCSEVQSKRSWRLLFDIRSATRTDIAAHDAIGERQGLVDDSAIQAARTVIASAFGRSATSVHFHDKTPEKLATLNPIQMQEPSEAANEISNLGAMTESDRLPMVVKLLEETLGMNRTEWPTSLLRQLWEVLVELESGRRISASHEARWLNLVGFTLRPGYGLAVDDWRCHETWKLLQGKPAFVTTACRVEWYILWRRIAGGLTAGQQVSLTSPLISQLKQAVRQVGSKGKGLDFGVNSHESSELLRLLGACELLPVSAKHELGDVLLEILGRARFSAMHSAALWALGRVGTRRPVYGPLNVVLPTDVVSRWLKSLASLKLADGFVSFAIMQLARKTGDRYRDLDETARINAIRELERASAPKHYRDLVVEVLTLDTEEESLILGDSLPKGLRIL